MSTRGHTAMPAERAPHWMKVQTINSSSEAAPLWQGLEASKPTQPEEAAATPRGHSHDCEAWPTLHAGEEYQGYELTYLCLLGCGSFQAHPARGGGRSSRGGGRGGGGLLRRLQAPGAAVRGRERVRRGGRGPAVRLVRPCPMLCQA